MFASAPDTGKWRLLLHPITTRKEDCSNSFIAFVLSSHLCSIMGTGNVNCLVIHTVKLFQNKKKKFKYVFAFSVSLYVCVRCGMACKMFVPVCVRCVPVYVLIMQSTLKEGILGMYERFLDKTSFCSSSKNLPSAAKHFVRLSNRLFCSSAKADFNSPCECSSCTFIAFKQGILQLFLHI